MAMRKENRVGSALRLRLPHLRALRLPTLHLLKTFGKWRGQATIELAVVFPVALALVVVSFNVVSYLGVCASFDRMFPQQARVFAAAPQYGANQADVAVSIQNALASCYARECSNVEVAVSADAWGNSIFHAAFEYELSLFGLRYRSILFGIRLPSLRHETSFALNCYRPGVVI